MKSLSNAAISAVWAMSTTSPLDDICFGGRLVFVWFYHGFSLMPPRFRLALCSGDCLVYLCLAAKMMLSLVDILFDICASFCFCVFSMVISF